MGIPKSAEPVCFPGHAEPAYPLSEEETFTGSSSENAAAVAPADGASVPEIKDNVGETSKSPLHSHGDEMEAELGQDDMAGLILAACYVWVRGFGSGGSSAAAAA